MKRLIAEASKEKLVCQEVLGKPKVHDKLRCDVCLSEGEVT
ncbi:MAG: hypothetical protein R2883_00110 [Caldisericia bacterium]